MSEKGTFDEELEKAQEDMDLKDFEKGSGGYKPQKSNTRLIMIIGLIAIIGLSLTSMFMSRTEDEGADTKPNAERIPIKGKPVMENQSTVAVSKPEEQAKSEEINQKHGIEKQVVLEKSEAGKKEIPAVEKQVKSEAIKQKPVIEEKKIDISGKANVAAKKTAINEPIKKSADVSPKPATAPPVPSTKKLPAPPATEKKVDEKITEAPPAGQIATIIDTYATTYELEAAKDKLKKNSIPYTVQFVPRKVTMHRVVVQETGDKSESNRLMNELKKLGYDPFSALADGKYKVYASSNFYYDIALANIVDLEKQGYHPRIEKKETVAKIHEITALSGNMVEAETLRARLKKLGFSPKAGSK